MKFKRIFFLLLCCVPALLRAADFDAIGVTFLRMVGSTLRGSNVSVLQAEASVAPGAWEVNPAAVGQPVSLFTWTSSLYSTSSYPNLIGSESWHADQVGNEFYDSTLGVAPGVAHVYNYEAGFFLNRLQLQSAVNAKIVNQSFISPGDPDSIWDNYAARYGTLFISGMGNGGPATNPPASCYNGIGVGAYGGSSSTGPTTNGRSKPDITAPASLTSFSTPQVSGAAAVLLQAANRDDGGTGTAAAAGDFRTLKALLLNGAEKPVDWTHVPPAPLDTRYGAGVLNVWNSYRQLRGGKQGFITSTSNPTNGAHFPPNVQGSVPTRRGWDSNSIANTLSTETVYHYFVDLRSASNRTFSLKATLVWDKQLNQTGINDLDLFLYDAGTSNLIGSSQSLVDNLEHLYLTSLPPARYDLQVLKNGGATRRVTANQVYALAFEFGPPEPAQLVNLRVVTGQFTGDLIGEPNQNYAIERSSNLALPGHGFTSILTNKTSASGSFTVTDAGTALSRFYRARLVP